MCEFTSFWSSTGACNITRACAACERVVGLGVGEGRPPTAAEVESAPLKWQAGLLPLLKLRTPASAPLRTQAGLSPPPTMKALASALLNVLAGLPRRR